MADAHDGGGASRSTDPAAGTSSATDVSLREYLTALIQAAEIRSDARFEAMQDAVRTAFGESQKAITKAETATEKRFESVNEFRSALTDQATRFVTRDALASLSDKLQAGIDRNRDDLDTLSQRLDLQQGETSGARLTKASFYVGVTLAVGIIGLLIVLANYLSTR
jgi:hypothetical protein